MVRIRFRLIGPEVLLDEEEVEVVVVVGTDEEVEEARGDKEAVVEVVTADPMGAKEVEVLDKTVDDIMFGSAGKRLLVEPA